MSKNLEQIKNVLKTLGVKADENEIYERIKDKKLKVIWLHFSECTGCSESFIRSESIGLDDLIFDYIDLVYHETYMASSGFLAESLLESKEPYLLIVEGAISANEYYTSGAFAHSAMHKMQELAKNALAIYAVGSCSSYGGIQAAAPNPTISYGIADEFKDAVLIPGCPPSESNIIASIMHFVFFNSAPNLDNNNRPAFAYAKCLHDMCERKVAFESGDFVKEFGDEAAKNGACLFKVGCKGPYTFNNCPKTKFNSKTSWPVAAGHGCIACSERDFWDNYGVYELSMASSYAQGKRKRAQNIINNFEKGTTCIKDDGIYKDNEKILSFEFEMQNIASFLSTNKLGQKLLANYEKEFNINLQADSKIASKFSDIFLAASFILNKEFKSLDEILKLANSYEIGIASGLDFKLNNNIPFKLDVQKSLRLVLIYKLGGLDDIAIYYGIADSIAQVIVKVLKLADIKEFYFEDEIFKSEIMQERLSFYLKRI